jgi:hypothetical protein
MRIRTVVLAGAAAAAAAYLADSREGKARRSHLLATTRTLTWRPVEIDRPIPLPENLAPIPPSRPEPSPVDTEPILATEPARSGAAEPVVSAMPIAGPNDEAIVRDVRTRLGERHDLRTDDLVVDVVNGVAYLSGDLQDRQTFGEVVDLTREVPGVRRVQSLLHLPDSETIVRTIAGPRTDERR